MKICQITGKRAMGGNNVSHSNAKTKRVFSPNLKTKKFFSEEEGRWITMKVSTSAIRTINKNGLSAAIKSAKALGKIY
ncbi:MAG: 50S ribosomal protein L28 [Rikenellaceae bacterium]